VEERNFGIRKQLLEYDEVRDVQRNYFYKRRQQILEGLNLREMIFEVITESVDDAVVAVSGAGVCVDGRSRRGARANFNCVIEPSDLRDTELAILESSIKETGAQTRRRCRSRRRWMNCWTRMRIRRIGIMRSWRRGRCRSFGVQVGVNQLKKMDRDQIRDGAD